MGQKQESLPLHEEHIYGSPQPSQEPLYWIPEAPGGLCGYARLHYPDKDIYERDVIQAAEVAGPSRREIPHSYTVEAVV